MNVGPFLAALLVLAVATARTDSTADLADIRAGLECGQVERERAAVDRLRSMDHIPDDLIADDDASWNAFKPLLDQLHDDPTTSEELKTAIEDERSSVEWRHQDSTPVITPH